MPLQMQGGEWHLISQIMGVYAVYVYNGLFRPVPARRTRIFVVLFSAVFLHEITETKTKGRGGKDDAAKVTETTRVEIICGIVHLLLLP